MIDKELNTPMKREQLNTPRELTAEELDMVFGGAIMKFVLQEGNDLTNSKANAPNTPAFTNGFMGNGAKIVEITK
jgi:hypothetical protein